MYIILLYFALSTKFRSTVHHCFSMYIIRVFITLWPLLCTAGSASFNSYYRTLAAQSHRLSRVTQTIWSLDLHIEL